ncbi:MAG: hypothetical protein JST81_13110 [Bacteroidetes bacterium]|nr:hypothetical protein [Bacteroidota bacterium]
MDFGKDSFLKAAGRCADNCGELLNYAVCSAMHPAEVCDATEADNCCVVGTKIIAAIRYNKPLIK